ncbi:MAG: ECF transporter S component [Spirochaetales bacterium]|nr:ECF transporter S component [Spirochaetales bacterium]MBP7262848.1 ECF transporter S component [Spirochaetia bacterium]
MEGSSVRKLVTAGALGAVSVVMAVTPLGFLPWFGGASLTIMHIPVIIAAVLEGPLAGTIVGLIFGVSSLMKAGIAPTSAFDPLFTNPLVSVLPRLFIGVAAWAVFRLFRGKFTPLASGVAGAVGGFTNTVLVLGMLGIAEGPRLASVTGLESGGIVPFLAGIAVSNGLIEAAAAAVLTAAVVTAWKGIAGGGKARLADEDK